MVYAPVLIPTMCRFEKFVKCFESLNENGWANRTDVYIALDYPKTAFHQEGYDKIKEYCERIIENNESNFNSVTLICRPNNLGAIENFECLMNEAFKKYDRCICTFDDIEHSKNFIQYMDEMLEVFFEDNNAVMVTGYSYPVQWIVNEECNVVRQNLEGSIWGAGFWRDKYKSLITYLRKGYLIRRFPDAYCDGKFGLMTDWALKDYVNAVVNGSTVNSLLKRVTDVAIRIYLSVENKYVIMPTLSKTRNNGFDGTGAFCESITYNDMVEETSSNYRFDLQPIDDDDSFEARIDYCFDNRLNKAIIDRFDKRPDGEREILLMKAQEYSGLNWLQREHLDFMANTSKVINKAKRMMKRIN